MAYANYEFYESEYFGNVIPPDAFARVAERASEELDLYTLNRLDGELPDDIKLAKRIQKANCAIAEIVYAKEQLDAKNGTDANGKGRISSESAGVVSISYSTELVGSMEALSNEGGYEQLIQAKLTKYLSGQYIDGINILSRVIR